MSVSLQETSAGRDRVLERDQLLCTGCGTPLPSGAHYCNECGLSADLVSIDPFHVGEPPMPEEPRQARPRRALWVMIAALLGTVGIVWALGATGDTARVDKADSETPAAVASSTIAPTSAAPTSRAPLPSTPSTTEPPFFDEEPGPVLDEGIGGTIVHLGNSEMRRIDLATGQITRFELEHPLEWGWYPPDSRSIIDGNHAILTGDRRLILTDLSTGVQPEPVSVSSQLQQWCTRTDCTPPDDLSDGHLRVVGRAGEDSVWVASEPWDGGVSTALEVGLDGKLLRRIDLPAAYRTLSGEFDRLDLESHEGFWRYDVTTATATRIPGGPIVYDRGLAVTFACDDELNCETLVDAGEGSMVVEGVDPADLLYRAVFVSPTAQGLLVHSYPIESEHDINFSYIDIGSGSRRFLGRLDIEPWAGITWVGETDWIVAHGTRHPRTLVAIDTRSGDSVPIELGGRSQFEGILIYVPPVAGPSVDTGSTDEHASAGPDASFDPVVLDPGTDDLCEWLTARKMNQIIAEAQGRAGTEVELERFSGDDGCMRWSDNSLQRTHAWASPGWWLNELDVGYPSFVGLHSFSSDVAARHDPESPAGDPYYEPWSSGPQSFTGHELLDDGITHRVADLHDGWGAGVTLEFYIEALEDFVEVDFTVIEDQPDSPAAPKYEELGLAIANGMFRELNWTGTDDRSN